MMLVLDVADAATTTNFTLLTVAKCICGINTLSKGVHIYNFNSHCSHVDYRVIVQVRHYCIRAWYIPIGLELM